MLNSSLPNRPVQYDGVAKSNEMEISEGSSKKLEQVRRNPPKPYGFKDLIKESFSKSEMKLSYPLVLNYQRPNFTLRDYLSPFLPDNDPIMSREQSVFIPCSKAVGADTEPNKSIKFPTTKGNMPGDSLLTTLQIKNDFRNLIQSSKTSYLPLPKLDDVNPTEFSSFFLGNNSCPANYTACNPNLPSENLETNKNVKALRDDVKTFDESTNEFATLHEYLSQKPLQDQTFWKKFDDIFEGVPIRQYTVIDLNFLVTVYEKLNLELFEESERPTPSVDVSDRSILADNLFCSVTIIGDATDTILEVTPCWSSPEQFRMPRKEFENFTRLQTLMVLSATCLLVNADKKNFGEVLAYAHLVKAAYDALELVLVKIDSGGMPITPWRDRVLALLSYAYYKLYLQEAKWQSYQESYIKIKELTRNALFEARITGGSATLGMEWPTTWEALLLTAEGFFNDRVSLTGRELWRAAAIATLCLDVRTRNSGSSVEISLKEEMLESLQRFTPLEDSVLKAVLSLKKFQFSYGAQWTKSCRPPEDTYSKKNLESFQQDVCWMLVQYNSLKEHKAPKWVVMRFRSQLLETVISQVVLLVIRSKQDSINICVNVLENLILDDFLALDGNEDTDECAHLRLASHSMFYFLTGQMTGRRPSTNSVHYDGHFALAVYSKHYIRGGVVSDSIFSFAVQAFEGPVDAFLKTDNCEKELLMTLFLMMPMLYERFIYDCSLRSISYTPKRFGPLSWLEIADKKQIAWMYGELRKIALEKRTEVENDLSTHLGKPKDIRVHQEFGSIKKEGCKDCHLSVTSEEFALDQTVGGSLFCIAGNSTYWRETRGTLFILDDCSDQEKPVYKEAAPETKVYVKPSLKTETCLNQSRLEDEIISLHRFSGKVFNKCTPVRVLESENDLIFSVAHESDLLELSSKFPCFLESSRIEEDFQNESMHDSETSVRFCETFTNNNQSTKTSVTGLLDDSTNFSMENKINGSILSSNTTYTTTDQTTVVNEFSKLSLKLDKGLVSSDEIEIFLSNALPDNPPGKIERPLEKFKAALCNSLLRIRESVDWATWKWPFEKIERAKFEAAMDDLLQKESEPPLNHMVDIFDYMTRVMESFLQRNETRNCEA